MLNEQINNKMKLRKITIEDLPVRVNWMNNPLIYNTMHYSIPITLDNTQKWFLQNVENRCRVDVTFCKSICNVGGYVAMGGLTSIDSAVKKAELYIFVNPELIGKGIGTKATKQLCQYGFTELGLEKIYLFTDRGNVAAQKVYEKIGFRLEGTLRNEILTRTGQISDRLYYGLLKHELIE